MSGASEPPELLHALVTAQARRSPQTAAVVCGGRTVSYGELDALASGLARRLQNWGVGPEVPVGVLAERSVDTVVTMLGVLQAGGAYLPVDPTNPPDRIGYMLRDAGAPVVVSPRPLATTVPHGPWRILVPDGATAPPPAPGRVDARNLAFVIYTSGSTGAPKGVMVTHHNAVRATTVRLCDDRARPNRYLMLAPFTVDASAHGLYWTLAVGGTLVVPTDREHASPAATLALAARHSVTHVDGAVQVYGLLLAIARPDRLPDLREVTVGGEALPAALAAAHYASFPGVPLFNEYGPTEATIWSTVYKVPAAGVTGTVPIGHPVPHARAYVLDGTGRPAPTGELHVGGVGVSRGYVNRPGVTAGRFVPDPYASEPGARMYRTGDLVSRRPDGVLEFLGRIDAQVKVRGYRVELGEIESVLLAHPGVRGAAVSVVGERLCAYVTATPGRVPEAQELIAYLTTRLPQYMVPAQYVFVATLPLTPAGKVDRSRLADPAGDVAHQRR